MKKLVLFVSIFVGIFSALSANIDSAFEILNKSNGPIWVIIINKDPWDYSIKLLYKNAQKMDKDTAIDADVDISKQTMLGIWLQDPITGKVENETLNEVPSDDVASYRTCLGVTCFDPQPDYLFTFSPGLPIFVTFNPDNDNESEVLYPQTGPLHGIKGVTKSGKPLKGNVQKRNIVSLK